MVWYGEYIDELVKRLVNRFRILKSRERKRKKERKKKKTGSSLTISDGL